MERLRIRFLYRRGDLVGVGSKRTPCTVRAQRYQTQGAFLATSVTYLVEDQDANTFWASEADLVTLRENLT